MTTSGDACHRAEHQQTKGGVNLGDLLCGSRRIDPEYLVVGRRAIRHALSSSTATAEATRVVKQAAEASRRCHLRRSLGRLLYLLMRIVADGKVRECAELWKQNSHKGIRIVIIVDVTGLATVVFNGDTVGTHLDGLVVQPSVWPEIVSTWGGKSETGIRRTR